MGATRIKGDALRLTIDGVDYWADCSQVTISAETFTQDSLEGPPEETPTFWFMNVTAVQSTEPGSLWRLLWDIAGGSSAIAYAYAPHGNETPSDSRPHFVGELYLPDVTTLGGEAGKDTQYVFSVKVPLLGRPQTITEPTDS